MATRRAALAAFLLLFAVAGRAQDAQTWQAKVFKGPRYSNLLSISNDRFYVDFVETSAWTVSTIRFEGKEVGQPSGATGAVFQWELNDPALKPDQIASPLALCKLIQTGAASETPTAARKLGQTMPADMRERVMQAADAKAAEALRVELAAALDACLRRPDFIEEPFLNVIPEGSARVYPLRYFKQLQTLRAQGDKADATEMYRLTRRLAEACLGKAITPFHRATGTGHGGEVLRSVALILDGKPWPIVQDGKAVYQLDAVAAGKTVTLRKDSVIGPFDHQAVFEFREGAPGYLVTHRFTVNADMAKGHFNGYMYDFMHMMPLSFKDFLVDLGGGKEWEKGNVDADGGKQDLLIDEPWKAMAAYSAELKAGVICTYPQVYDGKNHIYARGGKDKKFRASHVKSEGWTPGDSVEFKMRLTPFNATPEEWKDKARQIMRTETF